MNEEDPENDPIDLLNHETFSDMQSINTEDMSFNALSISPPLPPPSKSQTGKAKMAAHLSPPSQSNLFFENTYKNYNSSQQQQTQAFNCNTQSFEATLNEQSQHFYQQFPLLMMNQQHQQPQQSAQLTLNAPSPSLNNSSTFNGMLSKPPGLLGYASSSLFSNPSELSPFNYQTNKFNATYNFYNNGKEATNMNSSNYFNNFAESFDNASSFYENSTRFGANSDSNVGAESRLG